MLAKPKEFNWDVYENGHTGGLKLSANKSIQGTDKQTKCFSREKYAQKLFDLYTGHSTIIVKKDLNRGECSLVNDIYNVNSINNTADIEIAGGLSLKIELDREKRFVQVFGFDDVDEFVKRLGDRQFIDQLLEQNILAYVTEATPNVRVSLWQGYLAGVRNEFMAQIKNPSKAYTAKVKEANKGGFFVEVQGLDAFMPGSLAAPNKINDFQSYVGKEVIVMVEDFLNDMDSFIVSHKKYISYILPQKLAEINMMDTHSGTVTGASKYGLFVEFNEFFTGLLHVSKMSEETKELFKNRHYTAGTPIEFYVGEVTKDKRIILTEENPAEKLQKIQKFILNAKDNVLPGNIAAVMKFGAIVNVGEVTGLVPLKEFKRNNIQLDNYKVTDEIHITFSEFRDDKLIFSLPKS